VATQALKAQRSMPSLRNITSDWKSLPEMPEMPALPTTEQVSQGWSSVRRRVLGEPSSPLHSKTKSTATVPMESLWNRVLNSIQNAQETVKVNWSRDDEYGKHCVTNPSGL